MNKSISGFSKLSKEEKIDWITKIYLSDPEKGVQIIKKYWNSDEKTQALHDDFIENTISNFYIPLGVAPNFLINGKYKTIPMAIEESSVVAAASKAAQFWASRGGFKATTINTEKTGQVHFMFKGKDDNLISFFNKIKPLLFLKTESITKNMQQRGGGILDIVLKDKTNLIPNYFQLHVTFETKESMGANFINSCLEQLGQILKEEAENYESFSAEEKDLKVIMCILSNYVPNCLVRAEVSCSIEELKDKKIPNPFEFAERFVQAIQIAEVEPFRAVTHNKGIMNGIDAVILATGNDFRAIEAGIHAYAARNGQYSSLSHAKIENNIFSFWLEIPLAIGTIGGLTSLHPLVKFGLELLENPSAKELMEIVAVAGLAQNFAAINSLTTTGIQDGHMKMHLNNILNQLDATDKERLMVKEAFENKVISHRAIVDYIVELRK